jgi:hypothetical protein
MQRLLAILGITLLIAAASWPWLARLPWGRLPGDIVVERPNFRFYFPLATMIVVSVVLSLLARLFRR